MKKLALALLGMIGLHTCLAENLSGRLFFTPEERAALDRARAQNITIQNRQGNPNDGSLTLNGVILRSDGKQTFWLNGRTIVNGNDAADPQLHPSRQGHQLEMPLTHDSYKLKVGQSINPATGQTQEGYTPHTPPMDAQAASSTQGQSR